MGGEKKFQESGGFSEYEYKAVGMTKNGIKILEKVDGGSANLPIHSNTPFTAYAVRDSKTAELKQISIYGGPDGRQKIKDLDWSHKHTNPDGKVFLLGQIHVQTYKGISQHSKYARKPSKKEKRIVMIARYGA